MSTTKDRFQEFARSIPPLPAATIDRRAGQLVRRRRAWRAGVAAVAATGIAVPAALVAGGTTHHGAVISSNPGSPGMPATFVVMRQGGRTNEVDVVDSVTGAVVRKLYDSSTVDALATTTGDVYISTPNGIFRIPRGGGPPVQLSLDTPSIMSASPDGRRLAWAVSTQDGSFATATIRVLDLATGSVTSWLPPPESLAPEAPDSYQLDALGWRTNQQLAAVTEPPATESPSCPSVVPPDKPSTDCTGIRLIPANTPPQLMLFDVTYQSTPQTQDIPTQLSFFFGHLSNPGLLAAGPTAGTLIGAVYPSTNFQAGQPAELSSAGKLVELRLDADGVVHVADLATLAPGTDALSLDANGRDLLSVHDDYAVSRDAFTVQRATDDGPVNVVGPAGDIYDALW